MNSRYNVVEYEDGEIVNYYTLLSQNDDAIEEAEDFFIRMEGVEEHKDEFERFVEWMHVVANELGVRNDTFRGERACFALPPIKKVIGNSIFFRLYCHIVSPKVVILFNGDRKTPGIIDPEDCPNVRKHFLKGQEWASKLQKQNIKTDNKEIDGVEFIII